MKRLAIFAWPVAGIFLTLFEAGIQRATGVPVSALSLVWMSAGWLEWALFGPIVVALSKRVPYRPSARLQFVLVHTSAALVISTIHSASHFTIRTALLGAPGAPGHSFAEAWIAAAPIHLALDLFVYGATLTVTQIALFLQASRKRDEERLELERALAGAELEAYKLQLPAETVTARLREIERTITVDVDAAERLIEQFSTDLRQSLEVVRMHYAIDEIAQDEDDLEPVLPRSLPLPMLALLLFAVAPAVQVVFELLVVASAVALDRPVSGSLVLQHILGAAITFPITVAMVWIGSRFQRIPLVALAAAALPLLYSAMVAGVQGGWSAASDALRATSRTLDFLLFFAIGVSALAFSRYKAWRAKAVEIAELESRLLRTRATILRLQLNPHFLFNALNSVAALLEDDVDGATKMLAELRHFVGRVLESSDRDEVPLRQELELLGAYVAIENVRFDGRVVLDVRADDEARAAAVPSFFLQPLVENALRHGLTPAHGGRVSVRADVVRGALRIEIDDNGRADDAETPPREGVGLSNTRARLEQFYGDDYLLHIAARRAGFGVAVRLPYRIAEHLTDVR